MADSILENIRSLHAEIEAYKAAVVEMMKNPKTSPQDSIIQVRHHRFTPLFGSFFLSLLVLILFSYFGKDFLTPFFNIIICPIFTNRTHFPLPFLFFFSFPFFLSPYSFFLFFFFFIYGCLMLSGSCCEKLYRSHRYMCTTIIKTLRGSGWCKKCRNSSNRRHSISLTHLLSISYCCCSFYRQPNLFKTLFTIYLAIFFFFLSFFLSFLFFKEYQSYPP